MKFVSLPMYDWPEVETQTNKLWQQLCVLLKDNGIDCPTILDRKTPSESLWKSGHCLFSQTCGWPYINKYHSHLQLLTTPIYDIDGCDGTYHRSRLVCRANDQRNTLAEFTAATVVINESDSQSGHQAMKSALTMASLPAPFFAHGKISGAHRHSIKMVAEGDADICAVDPVSWQLALRYETPVTDQLKVIGEGPQIPGLPIVYSHEYHDSMQAANIAEKVDSLLTNELDNDIREMLFISGAKRLSMEDYRVLIKLDQEAEDAGHARVA